MPSTIIFTTSLASSNDVKGKKTTELHVIKTAKGTKRKVSAMVEWACNRSILTLQKRNNAMKRGYHMEVWGHTNTRIVSRNPRSPITWYEFIARYEDSEKDLLDELKQDYPNSILAILVTKNFLWVPNSIFSPKV